MFFALMFCIGNFSSNIWSLRGWPATRILSRGSPKTRDTQSAKTEDDAMVQEMLVTLRR